MKFIATLFVLLFFSTHSSALPIVFKEQLPYVEATINGKTIELMFDLGADAPVALTGSEIAATNVTVLDQTLKYGMADGSNFEVPLIRIDILKLGPWEKSNVAGHEFRFLGGANS
ncbi:MAG: aspartyl protease family protein, partial [Pseudomonadales bacterium]|nr:aspartyl protease family protein [Pseudomonadales bacterium]